MAGAAGPESVRAKYLVACDGGASTVRTQLAMPLEDLDFDEPWLVVDVRVNERGLARLPGVTVQYCEPERPCTLVIGPGNHRRWEISLKPGEDPKQVATPAETWKLLARWLTPEDGELWRQARSRSHALGAARWRRGRVFLAGDPAHMQPPFLGQGMCQGVRDVANLAWKLGAVLRGEVGGAAADRLLDSYGSERKAHVRELTSRIKGVGAVVCERDLAKARARDAKLLADCGGVVRDTPRQDILPRLEDGFLSARAHSARGSLFPQPWLDVQGERRRADAWTGNGWRLVLAPGTRAPDAAQGWHALRVLDLGGGLEGGGGAAAWVRGTVHEVDGVAAAWFRRHEVVAALVRPDNYTYGVAASAPELERLLEEARHDLGRAPTTAQGL